MFITSNVLVITMTHGLVFNMCFLYTCMLLYYIIMFPIRASSWIAVLWYRKTTSWHASLTVIPSYRGSICSKTGVDWWYARIIKVKVITKTYWKWKHREAAIIAFDHSRVVYAFLETFILTSKLRFHSRKIGPTTETHLKQSNHYLIKCLTTFRTIFAHRIYIYQQ